MGIPSVCSRPYFITRKKLLKWQPRSRQGVFVGFSPKHGSEVPLIINPRTKHLFLQFHVVFDDSFSTVASLQDIDEPTSFWNEFEFDEFL